MKLHFRKYGEGQPLLILHGLFGSSDNWQTLGRRFAEYFSVYLIDQRNHGHSPHSDEFSYDEMANDILELIQDEGLKNIILLGHSMGGKTAMKFAEKNQQVLNRLIVVDIAPKSYPPHHDEILEGLNSIDLNILKSRREVDKHLSHHIPDLTTRQFLMKNLYWREKGVLDWRINLPVLSEKIGVVIEKIMNQKTEIETLFLRGEKSNYILDSDFDRIKELFPNSDVITIENSGHWLHSEAPAAFFNEVLRFIL